jgi:hypothetical protein
MPGFIISDTKPVMIKICWQAMRDKTAGHIKRKINGVEFYMGNGVKQGNAPWRPSGNATPWHGAWR